jgi:uncharacterized membrane protein YccC
MIFFLTIAVAQVYSLLGEFSHPLMVLRLKETAIGAAIGAVVALVVVPLSTRDTVRAARANLFAGLSDLLNTAADRLDGATIITPDFDTLIRRLDDRQRQLTQVAEPLTVPLILGNNRPHARHRLDLYAAITTHARALAIALRHPYPGEASQLASACRSLAIAVSGLSSVRPGRLLPAVAAAFTDADRSLFIQISRAPNQAATDAVTHSLIQLEYLLRDFATAPSPDRPGGMADHPMAHLLPARHHSLVANGFHRDIHPATAGQAFS